MNIITMWEIRVPHKHWPNAVFWIRISCFVCFLFSSFVISWSSVAALGALLVSLYVLNEKPSENTRHSRKEKADGYHGNPLKGKPRVDLNDLPSEVIHLMERKVTELVTYDATEVDALTRFQTLKMNTECIFAKKAQLWGSANWDSQLSLESNIICSVATFLKFTCLCESLGLDGFLFELPGDYGTDVQIFGQAVRQILTVLSNQDPSGVHCMNQSYIGRKGWVFQFNKITFFITTFASCYPQTHSRYAFDSTHAYVLMQPEISFAQHDLPPDTPETEWDNPKTVRDRIRVAFREAGREYKIRDTIYFPTALEVVKPVQFDGPDITWWIPNNND